MHFGYDSAGRLRQLKTSQADTADQHWRIDWASNRLPGRQVTQRQERDNWTERVRKNWSIPGLNLLGTEGAGQSSEGPVHKWRDNQIDFDPYTVWSYSPSGNRIEQVGQLPGGQLTRQRLSWDGANRLRAVQINAAESHKKRVNTSEIECIDDALGCRIKNNRHRRPGRGGHHLLWLGRRQDGSC